MTFAKIENADEPYLHAIPYMQFPVLQAGRPFTGERGMIPGVSIRLRSGFLGPPLPRSLGLLPGESRRTVHLWRVGRGAGTPGNATDTRPLAASVPAAGGRRDVGVAGGRRLRPVRRSAAERQLWRRCLRIDNCTWCWPTMARKRPQVATADAYVPVDEPAAMATKEWTLPPRSLKILRRVPILNRTIAPRRAALSLVGGRSAVPARMCVEWEPRRAFRC